MSRGFKWALLAVFGLPVLGVGLIIFGEFFPQASALPYLLVGWASFIGNVLPKIEVNWSGVASLLLIFALLGGLGHGFCAWLWKGSGHAEPWKANWTAAGLVSVVLMFSAGMAFTGIAHQTGWLLFGKDPIVENRWSNVRGGGTSLGSYTSAQADFRANDRDNNKVSDFWRADIAGLYASEAEGQAIKLIDLSMAAADDRPKTDIGRYAVRSPKAGYWYRALLHADEKTPDPLRFAACSYPSDPGRWMYIVCEDNTIYQKMFEGEVPVVYPKDPLADGWTRPD